MGASEMMDFGSYSGGGNFAGPSSAVQKQYMSMPPAIRMNPSGGGMQTGGSSGPWQDFNMGGFSPSNGTPQPANPNINWQPNPNDATIDPVPTPKEVEAYRQAHPGYKGGTLAPGNGMPMPSNPVASTMPMPSQRFNGPNGGVWNSAFQGRNTGNINPGMGVGPNPQIMQMLMQRFGGQMPGNRMGMNRPQFRQPRLFRPRMPGQGSNMPMGQGAPGTPISINATSPMQGGENIDPRFRS